MAKPNNDNETTESSVQTIGERLQSARKEKKLSIADIANRLKLTKETIGYLESEQWDKLHGRAYAHGYLSSYIHFLGLPEDELETLFNSEYTIAESSLESLQSIEIPKKFPWVPLVSVILLAVITWFAYHQWQTDEPTENASVSTPSDNQNLLNNAVVLPLVTDENMANAVIDLKFSEDCWVEITDDDNRKLLQRIVQADQHIVLTGKPPLNVWLGQAAAVIVKYNNVEFDVAAHTKGDVARFTLGLEP